MTILKKRVMLVILVLVAAFATAAGFSVGRLAYGEVVAKTLDQVTFTMVEGAEVRLDDKNGMRFAGILSADDYEGLKVGYETLEFGVFIMPEAYKTRIAALNKETTFGENPRYIWGEDILTPVRDGKYRIIHMETLPYKYDGESYRIYGSVHNVLSENLALNYTACAYIKATDRNSDVFYKFATDLENPRSMIEIAMRAINSGDYDDTSDETVVSQRAVLDKYITDYVDYYTEEHGEAPSYSYTVNYYVYGNATPVRTENVAAAMNTAVNITPGVPRGYILDDEHQSVTSGHIYASNINLTVYLKVKPTIDITGECIDETVGVLGATCNKETQFIELPFDIGSLASLSDGVKIKWNDSWTQALDSQGYNAETHRITFSSDLLKTRINNATSGKAVYPLTIEGANAVYTAKVEIFGYRYALRVIETASDMANFDTGFFDNTENGGGQYDYYNYVIANDITGGAVSYEASVYNLYSGTIDGRGHVIENLDLSGAPFGLINYKAGNGAVIKNIALKNATGCPRNMLCYYADGVTLQNVYVSGSCGYTDLFETVQSGGLSATNIILNFTKASTGAQGGLWCDGVDATVTNRINWTGNCFGTYAGGLPAAWDDSGFTVENDGLYFYGTKILDNNG